MAGKEFPLSIVLRTNDQATAGLQKLQRQLEPIEKKLEAISKKMVSAGKKLTTNLTLPIVAIGTASIKTFAEFEQGMSNVATLVDDATVDMAAMNKEVLAIGRRVPVAYGELTAGLYDLISGGVDASEALNVLERSAQLATAGLATTGETTTIVTSTMEAFGLKGEEANGIYDALFTTVKNGKLTLSQLGQGFGGAAAMAGQNGVAFDEYLASVAALTTVGNTASEAQNKIKAALVGLMRPTKGLSKVLKDNGVKSFEELIEKSGGMVPAFKILSDSVGGSKEEILAMAGSAEAATAIIGLATGQNEAYNKTLEDMRDGHDSVGPAAAKQAKTLAAEWQKTKNSLASAGIAIGKILAPTIGKLGEKLQAASEWWESLTDGSKETIVTIAGMIATIGPGLIVFGKLASGIAAVSKAMKVMNTVTKANVIVASLAAIAWAAKEIYDEWQSFEEFFDLLWGAVKGGFGDAWDFIQKIVDKVAGAVDKVIEKAKEVKQYFSPEMERRTVSEGALERWKVAGGLALPDDGGKRRLVSSGFEAGPDETGMGAPALGADRGASLGGQGGQGGAGANGTIKVRFENPPKGMRANIETGSNLELNTGDQMGVD